MQYILASQSPRRQELLRLILSNFDIFPADVDETLAADVALPQAVGMLAAAKAAAVFATHPQAVVIGSDTVVVVDGQVLGKPTDAADAMRMLQMLSGRAHVVMTGYAISNPITGAISHECTQTAVQFADLTIAEIEAYIASGEPMDKAGAYGIQGLGARFVERIDGDYYSVMGLPVQGVYTMLRALDLL